MWEGGGVSSRGYGGDGYVYDKGLSLSPKGTFSSAFVFLCPSLRVKARLNLKDCSGLVYMCLCMVRYHSFLIEFICCSTEQSCFKKTCLFSLITRGSMATDELPPFL